MVVSFEVARIVMCMYVCCLGMSPLADLTNMRLVRRLPAEKGPSGELGLVCFCVWGWIFDSYVLPLVLSRQGGRLHTKKSRVLFVIFSRQCTSPPSLRRF